MFLYPSQATIIIDQQLTAKSIHLFDKILEVVNDQAFVSVRRIVEELSRKASSAVEDYQSNQQTFSADTSQDFIADWNMLWTLDDWGYSPFPPFDSDPNASAQRDRELADLEAAFGLSTQPEQQ